MLLNWYGLRRAKKIRSKPNRLIQTFRQSTPATCSFKELQHNRFVSDLMHCVRTLSTEILSKSAVTIYVILMELMKITKNKIKYPERMNKIGGIPEQIE